MKELLCTLFLLYVSTAGAIESEASVREVNNGEDITRPITRFDLRVKLQGDVETMHGKTVIVTARTDQQITFGNGWQLGLRADLPYEWFRCPHACSSASCKSTTRLGDSLLQALLITPVYGKWTFAVGAKVIFPTAGDNLEVGDGKYQMLPSVAFRYGLGNWVPGAYCGVLLRHDFSVGGYKSAPAISQTFIQPFFNLDLPHRWFINSSPEMIYNWKINAWFIPFDLMVGKMIRKNIVASIEYESAIVNDYAQYRQQVEFRIGYFF